MPHQFNKIILAAVFFFSLLGSTARAVEIKLQCSGLEGAAGVSTQYFGCFAHGVALRVLLLGVGGDFRLNAQQMLLNCEVPDASKLAGNYKRSNTISRAFGVYEKRDANCTVADTGDGQPLNSLPSRLLIWKAN